MHHRARLTAEDTARLHMDRRENPMIITAMLLLDGGLDHVRLVSRLEARLPYRRFRERVIEPRFGLGMPRWEDDPSFDVREHVRSVDVASVDEDTLSDLVSMPLDARRALWDACLLERTEAGSALVFRVHHALADGSALLAILGDLTDEGVPDAASKPASVSRSSLDRGRGVTGSLLAAGRLALARDDPRTRLRGRLGSRKRVAFSAAIPLDALLATAHALGASLVAVLLAAVAGALGLRLAAGQCVDELVLHALVPVNVPTERARDAGNHYGSMFVPLPIGLADPVDRVRAIDADLRALSSRDAVTRGVRLATSAGLVTAAVERIGVAFFSRKASVMVSNVRGPSRALHLDGVAVKSLIVWAPSPGNIGLGVTFTSYAGVARIGVAADAGTIGDPRDIAGELERELVAFASFASPLRA